jgi:hypothetical protein
MKIAVVHALPLEYYPPARNMIELLAERSDWKVQAWSSTSRRGAADAVANRVTIHRYWTAPPPSALPFRIAGYTSWHLRTALGLLRWRPDAVISIEPHSALAVALYFRLRPHGAKLVVHHHEYYAPEDFTAAGMRLLRATKPMEAELFERAAWVSQTNEERLRLLLDDTPSISRKNARVLPNYPPRRWVASAERIPRAEPGDRLRLLYVGSASFEDTFIREAVEWAVEHTDAVTLHVCGDNIKPDVVTWIRGLRCATVTVDDSGIPYELLPSLLRLHDVGLVLYKGNTLNFVHNVPNKAIEYLACGLQVWYPPAMKGMSRFHQLHPGQNLVEMNFESLPSRVPAVSPRPQAGEFPFTAESSLAELVRELERAEPHK